MKKIFSNMAHKATVLAAVMLATFSFSLTSCSDDDDDDDAPKTETVFDKIKDITWFEYEEHENGEIDYYGTFTYITDNTINVGNIIQDDAVAEYWSDYFELPIKANDLLIFYKYPVNDIKIISGNTIELSTNSLKCIFELSEDGIHLKGDWYKINESEPFKSATMIEPNTFSEAVHVELGKIWDVSD